MNDYYDFEIREANSSSGYVYSKIKELLSVCGLREEKLDYLIGIFDGDENAVACGGIDGETIKCIAVSPEYRRCGLFEKVVSHLETKLLCGGVENIKVFTKPENEQMFVSMGFSLVEKADKAIFLERGRPGITEFVEGLMNIKKDGTSGAVVMNCNPFTNGHLHLVEYAAGQCDNLYVFVVEEDKSVFPFDVRLSLARKNTEHIKNAKVIPGGKYIISSSVFPSYFIKEYSDITRTHAELDLKIFARYVCPALGITKRFVGEEPNDRVTAEYNRVMKEILGQNGIEQIIIERKKDENGRIISASEVRKLLAENDFAKVRSVVPEATYDFAVSDKGKEIIRKIWQIYGEK